MNFENQLLVFDSKQGHIQIVPAMNWIDFIKKDDVVIVNASSTLPSSLHALIGIDKENVPASINIRLATYLGDCRFNAIVYSAAFDYHPIQSSPQLATELHRLDHLTFPEKSSTKMKAKVINIEDQKLLTIQFECTEPELFSWIYKNADLVSYSDVSTSTDLKLWDVQNSFSSIPMSNEWPFAGRLLTPSILINSRRHDIKYAPLYHGCALSSFGDDQNDQSLPLPEKFMIHADSLNRIRNHSIDRRFCLGTSALRAVESFYRSHTNTFDRPDVPINQDFFEITRLKLSADERPKIIKRLLMGFHEIDSSHFSILRSFVTESEIDRILTVARSHDFRQHEGGDFILIQ